MNLPISIVLVFFISSCSFLHSQAIDKKRSVAAYVNGEPLYVDDLDAAVKAEVDPLLERVQSLRRMMLRKLIDNRLIEQDAKSKGMSVEDYLRKYVESSEVDETQVAEAYSRSRERFPGQISGEIKYRIRRTLEDNARASKLRNLMQTLRQQAKVRDLYVVEIASQLAPDIAIGIPSLGPTSASVTLVEFVDMECPYCKTSAAKLKKTVEEFEGNVRLVMRHFPLESHPNAYGAAKAAICAEKQGLFWEFFDKAMAEKTKLSTEQIFSSAHQLGIDVSSLEKCIQDPETDRRLRDDIALARSVGVTGTPTVFLNGRRLDSMETLSADIRAELMSSSANNH